MSDSSQNNYEVQFIDCPACQSTDATVISHVMDIPYYTDFIMVSVNCKSCGYRSSNFYNMHSKGHTRHIYRVDDESDDTTKVVRSVDGSVEIPELEIEIEPYGAGTSWIRNIEGILDDIKQKLMTVLRDETDKKVIKKIRQRLQKLKKLQDFELPFTIIVDDPSGNSLILASDENKLETVILENQS